jgi:hypothetical protein
MNWKPIEASEEKDVVVLKRVSRNLTEARNQLSIAADDLSWIIEETSSAQNIALYRVLYKALDAVRDADVFGKSLAANSKPTP